jgi:VanZ family protein
LSFRLDHLLHVLAFIPLYPLVFWVFSPQTRQHRLVYLFISMLFAALAEFVQYFIDYRAYNPADLISNLAGVLLGFLLILAVKKY